MRGKLPEQIHEAKGNASIAIDRTADIRGLADRAVEYLRQSQGDRHGPHLRAGYLKEGDEMLDAIIRYANTAKVELRIAYCPNFDGVL